MDRRFIPPRPGGGYPLDLDGSLRFERPAAVPAVIQPYPPVIGYLQGLLPMMDHRVLSNLYARTPFGPWMGELQNQYPAQAFALEKMVSPELPKVKG